MKQDEVWDKIAEPWQKYRKYSPKEVVDFLKDKKGKILDVGCGSGRNIIANPHISYYGVDFSEEMLKFARENAKKKGVKYILKKSGAEELPFEDNFFEVAICISTLHCIENEKNRKKTLEELYRVLKKDGEAMISVWNKDTNDKLSELKTKEGYLNWQKDGKTYQRYYYFYDKDELQKLLQSIGFKVLKTRISGDEKHSKKNFIFYVKK